MQRISNPKLRNNIQKEFKRKNACTETHEKKSIQHTRICSKSTQTPHDSAGDICGEKNVLDARKNSTPHMQHVHLGRSYAACK